MYGVIGPSTYSPKHRLSAETGTPLQGDSGDNHTALNSRSKPLERHSDLSTAASSFTTFEGDWLADDINYVMSFGTPTGTTPVWGTTPDSGASGSTGSSSVHPPPNKLRASESSAATTVHASSSSASRHVVAAARQSTQQVLNIRVHRNRASRDSSSDESSSSITRRARLELKAAKWSDDADSACAAAAEADADPHITPERRLELKVHAEQCLYHKKRALAKHFEATSGSDTDRSDRGRDARRRGKGPKPQTHDSDGDDEDVAMDHSPVYQKLDTVQENSLSDSLHDTSLASQWANKYRDENGVVNPWSMLAGRQDASVRNPFAGVFSRRSSQGSAASGMDTPTSASSIRVAEIQRQLDLARAETQQAKKERDEARSDSNKGKATVEVCYRNEPHPETPYASVPSSPTQQQQQYQQEQYRAHMQF